MAPRNVKTILFIECAFCWVEILVVLTIDSIFLKIIADETYKVWQEFFEAVVECFIFIDQKEGLIAFLIVHLVAHVILLLVSMVMLMGIFMVKPASLIGTGPFIVAIGVVNLIELISTIYFAVETSRVYQQCSKSLFLPLYFCKGIFLWIVNLMIAKHVHTLRSQLKLEESGENEISHSQPGTIYTLPWQNSSEQTSFSGLDTSVFEPRNNSSALSYQTQTSGLTFRGSVSTDSIHEAEYRYWDSYENIKS